MNLQTMYRTALRAGNAESVAGSSTYGHRTESRLRRATNAQAGLTFILVVPSTFYVAEPDRFDSGDGLRDRVFGSPEVACRAAGWPTGTLKRNDRPRRGCADLRDPRAGDPGRGGQAPTLPSPVRGCPWRGAAAQRPEGRRSDAFTDLFFNRF